SVYTGCVATETWPVQGGSAIFGAMMRKQRGRATTSNDPAATPANGPWAICGMSDARGLVGIDLANEASVSLCGSHELMHRRSGCTARTVAELRIAFGNRRAMERRGGPGGSDEVGGKL